jgi:hypothetical protein
MSGSLRARGAAVAVKQKLPDGLDGAPARDVHTNLEMAAFVFKKVLH